MSRYYNLVEPNNENNEEGQLSLHVDDKGTVWDMEETEPAPVIIDENGKEEDDVNTTALSLIRGGRFDARLFHEQYEDNTEKVLEALLALQSNASPLKKGGESVAFRADALILQNRQNYSAQENTLLDIITGVMSSRPEDSFYKIYVKDCEEYLPYNSKYVYELFSTAPLSLNRQPFIFEIALENGKTQILEFQWNEYLMYYGKSSIGKDENAYIMFKPTKFFRILTAASSIAHGAHYSIGVASQIKSSYVKTLYYFLESTKNRREYPGGTPGNFSLTFDEFRYIIKYPASYEVSDIRKRILDEGMKEINHLENVDFNFSYELIKETNRVSGRKRAVGIRFSILTIVVTKEVETKNPAQLEEKTENSPEYVMLINGLHLTDQECKDVLKLYHKNKRDIAFLTQAMTSVLTSPNILSPAAVLCEIMKNGINENFTAEKNKKRQEKEKERLKKRADADSSFQNTHDYDYEELEKRLISNKK